MVPGDCRVVSLLAMTCLGHCTINQPDSYFALFTPKSNGKYTNPEDKTYYYIRYAATHQNIVINHVPYFNAGPFFEINSFAQRSVALIGTVDMMFNKNVKIEPDILFENRSAIIQQFFKTIAIHTNIENVNAFVQKNESKVAGRKILFIDPSQSNQRLIMQQGLFMFPYTLDKNEHLNIIENNTRIIRIHKDLRESLIGYLDTIGINAFRIMSITWYTSLHTFRSAFGKNCNGF